MAMDIDVIAALAAALIAGWFITALVLQPSTSD